MYCYNPVTDRNMSEGNNTAGNIKADRNWNTDGNRNTVGNDSTDGNKNTDGNDSTVGYNRNAVENDSTDGNENTYDGNRNTVGNDSTVGDGNTVGDHNKASRGYVPIPDQRDNFQNPSLHPYPEFPFTTVQGDYPQPEDGLEVEEDEEEDESWEELVEEMETKRPHYPRALPLPPTQDPEGNKMLTVVDVSGVHHLPLVECQCAVQVKARDLHLVEIGLLPASFQDFRTAFTLKVLEDHRLENLECKTSSYQYYQKLRRMTCSAFPQVVPNRYRELRRVSRQYRNLKLWEVFGFGHTDEEPTKGSLALFCPACPQPEINLPEGWEQTEDK